MNLLTVAQRRLNFFGPVHAAIRIWKFPEMPEECGRLGRPIATVRA